MLHDEAQYASELVGELIQPILRVEADMVFGTLTKGHPLKGGMSLCRSLGNLAFTTVQNIFLGTRLSEFHSGYRIYSAEALKKIPFERLSSE